MELGPSHSLAAKTPHSRQRLGPNVLQCPIGTRDVEMASWGFRPAVQSRNIRYHIIPYHTMSTYINININSSYHRLATKKESLKAPSYDLLTNKNRGTWIPTFPSAALVFAASGLYFFAASRKPKGDSQQPLGSSL